MKRVIAMSDMKTCCLYVEKWSKSNKTCETLYIDHNISNIL